MKQKRYVFLIPESHAHLGLFKDLEETDAELHTIKKKSVKGIRRIFQKIWFSDAVNRILSLPFREMGYDTSKLRILKDCEYELIFLDGSLRGFSAAGLKKLIAKKNVNARLVLINSVSADSAVMHDIKKKIFEVSWDKVYSFDPEECKRYGWIDLQNAYYSVHDGMMQDTGVCEESGVHADYSDTKSDICFFGGVKGNRAKLITELYEKLSAEGVQFDCNLHLARLDQMRYGKNKKKGVHYLTGGWIPYESVLEETKKSNVILEVLQEGQHGPSLRYFEAVLMRKKLLSTNEDIDKLPFYNAEQMKVLRSGAEVSPELVQWIKDNEPFETKDDAENIKKEAMDYCSPIRFLERLRKEGS